MSFDPTFSISQRSESYFRDVLPPTWLKREQWPDFYIDFVVELDSDDGPSGLKCAVQLRGTASPRYRKESIQHRVKTKALAYYVDRSPEPVFLVVVDVQQKQGYWTHLQQWAKDHPEWRKQKSVTIEVPVENKLDDLIAFRRAIEEAVASMQSVTTAADGLQKKYERLDSRFAIEVGFIKGNTMLTLVPRETVKGLVRVLGPQSSAKLTELVEKGNPTHFERSELELEGSRIFTELLREATRGGITLHAVKRVACSVSILTRDENGGERPLFTNLASVIEAGTRELRVDVTIAHSPLTLHCTAGITQESRLAPGKFNTSFEYQQWMGQDLLHVAHFEGVRSFVQSANAGNPLVLQVDIDGNRLFRAAINLTDSESFASINPILELLELARRIARHLAVEPKTPTIDDLFREEQSMLLISEIIEKGELTQPVNSASGTLECTAGTLRMLIDAARRPDSIDPTMEFLEVLPPILGCPADKWRLRRRLTRVALTPDSERLVQAHSGDPGAILSVRAQATQQSHCITKLVRVRSDDQSIDLHNSGQPVR
jgi:hypothetical protein